MTAAIKQEKTRDAVCQMYKIEKEPGEDYSLTLKKAYYAYLSDPKFCEMSEKEKENNDKLILAILKGWIIPEMEKNPAEISDEELEVSYI